MPKHKDPNDERERKEREQREQGESARHEHEKHAGEREGREDREGREGREGRGDRDDKDRDDKDRPRRRRMGREHAVHQQILDRRVGGGAPPTPEAYAKGLEQWQQLPGAVMRPPTDEKPAKETKKPEAAQADDEEKRK